MAQTSTRNHAGGASGQPGAPTLLVISSDQEDHDSLRRILSRYEWKTTHCKTSREGVPLLDVASVVLCDDELADGDWRGILSHLQTLLDPPVLIVTSRLADARLWGEVLNFGGGDLISKPFETQEVIHSISSAVGWRASARRGGQCG